jgi:SAM-dependent methyltransferase
LSELYSGDSPSLSVFDLACGNLRFESFLSAELPAVAITFYAVDNCDGLVPPSTGVNFQNLDVLKVLHDNLSLSNKITAPECDLSVSFGFMHHIPLSAWREAILRCLIQQTRSGGFVVVSLWQFLANAALADKAQITHRRALEELQLPELDSGDYLLGWKDLPRAYRYCHSFSENEIDHLAESVADKATLVSRFVSDGRTDNLNTYLVLKVV